jgi:hypothetical protein
VLEDGLHTRNWANILGTVRGWWSGSIVECLCNKCEPWVQTRVPPKKKRKRRFGGWRYSSVVEHTLSALKALVSIPGTKNKKHTQKISIIHLWFQHWGGWDKRIINSRPAWAIFFETRSQKKKRFYEPVWRGFQMAKSEKIWANKNKWWPGASCSGL